MHTTRPANCSPPPKKTQQTPGTQLETEALRCAYSATEDGWGAAPFHALVDGYGAALVVARTEVGSTGWWQEGQGGISLIGGFRKGRGG